MLPRSPHRFAAMLGYLALVTACDVPGPATSSSLPAPTSPPAVVVQVEDKVVLEGARALTLAALAYESVALAAGMAADAGVLRGESAAMVQRYNRDILNALELGARATSAADKARYARAVFGWVEKIKSLVGG